MPPLPLPNDRPNYVECALRGDYTDRVMALDDAIDTWHDRRDDRFPVAPMHEWLGFTWEEYRRWAEDPSALDAILAGRATPPVDS